MCPRAPHEAVPGGVAGFDVDEGAVTAGATPNSIQRGWRPLNYSEMSTHRVEAAIVVLGGDDALADTASSY